MIRRWLQAMSAGHRLLPYSLTLLTSLICRRLASRPKERLGQVRVEVCIKELARRPQVGLGRWSSQNEINLRFMQLGLGWAFANPFVWAGLHGRRHLNRRFACLMDLVAGATPALTIRPGIKYLTR
jgi:hypothetical protein